jgi:subtilisin family serine protease
MSVPHPAYSASFTPEALKTVRWSLPVDAITPAWAWGSSTGRGVKVAVIDSGIDASHPDVGGQVLGYVAITDGPDGNLAYNPSPPVEFGAPGINLRVAWLDRQWITSTGNSYAAPHSTGLVAKILGKHQDLTTSEMKIILRVLAANVVREGREAPEQPARTRG